MTRDAMTGAYGEALGEAVEHLATSTTSRRASFVPTGPYGVWIAGEERPTTQTFEAIDPSTGKPWANVAQASAAEVDEAVTAARRAFPSWRKSTPAQRQELLWRMADMVEERASEWPALLATENGRPIREASIADIPTCAAILRYFSGLARHQHGDEIPLEDPDSLVYTVREPLGVIAALIPWNSPIITLANKIGPALAAGNAVVIKPSEYASPSVIEFARAVGGLLPPGVLNVVTGFGPEVGATLVSHPDVAKITFTGGTATARRIMSAAGERLTPALMELGGKGAMIVCQDADLEAAVSDALLGIFMANGEVCVAASRLLVHEALHDEFLELFVRRASSIVVGDALDPETQFGPLISAAHLERVIAALERGIQEGALVAVGGEPLSLPGPLTDGFFVAPTLLQDDNGQTSASRDEFFGPVTVLERFTNEAEAVGRANATQYGLAAGVWTQDLARGHRIARELDAGIVWINKWFDLPVGVPMGGVKESGFGRELSAETLLEYSAPKVVNVGLSKARTPLFGSAL
jgi:acyl-CoA reductase-like NAD-dependent aldehyde dehydrogenase